MGTKREYLALEDARRVRESYKELEGFRRNREAE